MIRRPDWRHTAALIILTAIVSACGSQPFKAQPQAAAAEPPWRILVTNDDGIESEGLRELALALSEVGEVVVVAPAGNASGSSQSTRLFSERLTAAPVDLGDRVPAWAVNGSPADCTAFGIRVFGQDDPFDLVVSGVNYGNNSGISYFYSGTVGAAFQGQADGIPSIAVSQDHRRNEWSTAARFAAEVANSVLAEPLPPGEILSINVPEGEVRGVRARAGYGAMLQVKIELDEDELGSYYKPFFEPLAEPPADSDLAALEAGYITVTPLRLDRNAYDSLEAVERRPFVREWASEGEP
jgi:5'-nucleotidase